MAAKQKSYSPEYGKHVNRNSSISSSLPSLNHTNEQMLPTNSTLQIITTASKEVEDSTTNGKFLSTFSPLKRTIISDRDGGTLPKKKRLMTPPEDPLICNDSFNNLQINGWLKLCIL